ncbi:MAG TPA: lipopolysaccharide kinase InaA family protein [Candidatus Binataceae bacterium]|nr:lipopolysaccharide kinase InaA family protein [Candidatus Binataceae bacterium]
MRTHVLYARSRYWRSLIERADELMASPVFHALKDEGRTIAGVLELPGRPPVFLKRTRERSWPSGIAARGVGSRAARALAGAEILAAAGIAHPAPLAAMNQLSAGAVRASYLMSEALAGADSLSRFALGPGEIKGRDARRRRRILGTVAREVKRMHDAGIYTRDLQETNVMVADGGGGEGFRVWFIDLEDIRRVREVSRARRIRNLVHLDRSIGRFLCRAARLAFLYDYLGAHPEPGQTRRMVRDVLAMRAQIDHSRARRRMPRSHPRGRARSALL